MVLPRSLIFISVLLLGNAWSTDVVSGREYCADDFDDLDLPAESCMMQGYLQTLHYSETDGKETGFSLHGKNGVLLRSSYFGLPLNMRYSYQMLQHTATSMQINQALLLTTFSLSQNTPPAARVVYRLGPDAELEILRLQVLRGH